MSDLRLSLFSPLFLSEPLATSRPVLENPPHPSPPSTRSHNGFRRVPKVPLIQKRPAWCVFQWSLCCLIHGHSLAGWNSAWERDLATIYGSGIEITSASRRPVPSIIADLPTQYYNMMLADTNVLSLQTQTKQVCVLQRDLTRKSARKFAEDDFEAHWTTRCSVKERENFILEGLVRTCEASPDFEDHRKWCPELTLKRLNRDSGKGFIDLLNKLTLQDVDKVPDDFRTVPNAVYDKINKLPANPHPGLTIAKKSCDAQRLMFLTMAVWNTLLAFYGETETIGLVKGQRDDREELKRIQKTLPDNIDLKRLASETAANRRDAERNCTACGLTASRAGTATLSACQRCKVIDRLVFYCSKECQTKDWKTGRPPHKSICGKKGAITDAYLTDEYLASNPPAVDDDDFFGAPEPGYVRSPALLHQLSLLKENPQVDYVLVRPAPHPDHGVVLQASEGSLFFKIMLKRAACGHAPREVLRMFQQLSPTAREARGVGVAGLKAQLLKEFGVDVDKAAAQFDKA
ncbi:hypothetical protein DFH06DRAFT_1012130 [Mycena polygramma]|nr:hypothetical protein DFH06DRAFT_1012130 [Mycena polygramma]